RARRTVRRRLAASTASGERTPLRGHAAVATGLGARTSRCVRRRRAFQPSGGTKGADQLADVAGPVAHPSPAWRRNRLGVGLPSRAQTEPEIAPIQTVTHSTPDDFLPPEDRPLAERLFAERPLPRAAFRGELRR